MAFDGLSDPELIEFANGYCEELGMDEDISINIETDTFAKNFVAWATRSPPGRRVCGRPIAFGDGTG